MAYFYQVTFSLRNTSVAIHNQFQAAVLDEPAILQARYLLALN